VNDLRRTGITKRGAKRLLKVVGVSLYALVVRITLAVVALVLWVYFAVNSAFVAGQISTFATDALPGSVTAAHVQWGPAPGYLRLIKPVVKAPDATVVIAAEWLDLRVDWTSLVSDLVAGRDAIEVRILTARMVAPRIRLDTDDRGRLKIALAFADPDAAKKKDGGRPFMLSIDSLSAREVDYFMQLNGTKLVAKGGELEGSVAMRTAANEKTTLSWETRTLTVAHAQVWLDAFDRSGLKQLPGGPFVVQSMKGDLERVDIQGASMDLPHINLARSDYTMTLGPPLDIRGSRVLMTASTRAPMFNAMLGPLFDCDATIDGGFHWRSPTKEAAAAGERGLFEATGNVTGEGLMGGFMTRSVKGRVAMKMGHHTAEHVASGKPSMEIDTTGLVIDAFDGRLRSDRVRYKLFDKGRMTTRGKIASDNVSIGKVLATQVVNIGGKAAIAMQGRLSGVADTFVDFTMRKDADELRKAGKPPFDLQVTLDTDLRMARQTEGVLLKKALPQLFVRGGIDYATGPDRGTKMAFRKVELSNLGSGEGIDMRPTLAHKAQWLKADGVLALTEGKVRLKTDLHMPDLAALLEPLDIKGITGALSLRNAEIEGDLLAPRVKGKLQGRKIVAAGYSVEEIDAGLGLRDGKLTLDGANIAVFGGRLSGDFAIGLFSKDLKTIRKLPVIEARKLSVFGMPVQRIIEPMGITNVRTVCDVRNGSLDIDLREPMKTIRFSGQTRLVKVDVPYQKYDALQANVLMTGGKITLDKLVATIPAAGRGRRPVQITGRMALDITEPKPLRYDIDLDTPRLDFDQLDYLRGLRMPMRGQLAGRIKMRGDLVDAAMDLDLQVTGLAWDKIWMGDSQVSLAKKRGKPAIVTSRKFFKRFDLLDKSTIIFERLIPNQWAINMRAHDLDPMQFLGLEPMQGARVITNGTGLFKMDFRPGKDVFSVALEVPDAGMEVELDGGFDNLRNKGIMRMMVLPTRVDFQSTRFQIGREVVEMCGAFLYADQLKKLPARLRMYMAGTLDVPRFGALKKSMATLDMRLSVMRSPALKGDTKAWCLRKPAKGAMRLTGPFDGLRLDGRLKLKPSTVVPRGFGKEVLLAGGGAIDLRTDGKEGMTITVDESHTIEGRIDDGRFRFHGTAQMVKYKVDHMNAHFEAEDYEYVQPKEYSVIVAPTLHVVGTNMLDDKRRDVTLSGDVKVTEAAYTKSHDALRAIGQNLVSREVSGGGESFLEKNPAYKDIKLKLRVSGRNIEVTSKLPFLRTDVEMSARELKVGGTLGNMTVDGRLRIEHGSTLTYELFKREFEVEKGFLDFSGNVANPNVQVQARTDIELAQTDDAAGSNLDIGPGFGGSAGSGSGQIRIIKVWVGVDGLLFDPAKAARGDFSAINKKLNIRLWSMPSYDQANLMALVLTGNLLTGGQGASLGLGYLTNELSEIFASTLLSSFIKLDKFEVAPKLDGGALIEVRQKLGRSLSIAGKAERGGARTSTEASFNFRISDRLSFDGMARSAQSTQYNQQIYRATLRYRVPIERFSEIFGL